MPSTSMRTRFLNPDVEREVRANPTLWVTWCITVGDYDDDIDPLHNPDFVARAKRREVDHLANLKRRVAEAEAAFVSETAPARV